MGVPPVAVLTSARAGKRLGAESPHRCSCVNDRNGHAARNDSSWPRAPIACDSCYRTPLGPLALVSSDVSDKKY